MHRQQGWLMLDALLAITLLTALMVAVFAAHQQLQKLDNVALWRANLLQLISAQQRYRLAYSQFAGTTHELVNGGFWRIRSWPFQTSWRFVAATDTVLLLSTIPLSNRALLLKGINYSVNSDGSVEIAVAMVPAL
ncbi:hypothetical protein CWI84_04815 [Idiomarina tyrosinivorans]|uniref:Uncharacterized protein n=1 Tax=Idiomarina tyrosinivorans TaxID=1445662 RepID=A0A432ZR87_9GAMM|nr:hypothetical protein [Idiomarina tyrosinivorans]RUO80393.1 hypothetical protein CWI84_04815 [Idiomarina tyrosinivorans]